MSTIDLFFVCISYFGKLHDLWVYSVILVKLYFCILQSGFLFIFVKLNYFSNLYNDVCIC